MSSDKAEAGAAWMSTANAELEKYLVTIQAVSGQRLYAAQQRLMLPLEAAYDRNIPTMRQTIVRGLNAVLEQAVTLGSLREAAKRGEGALDPALLSPSRSGHDDRLIFPTVSLDNAGAKRVSEERLNQLQFCFLLSATLRSMTLAQTVRRQQLSPEESAFGQRCFKFLLHSIVEPYWTEVEAWWYERDYPNMRERALSRLAWKDSPYFGKYSYYKAFTDEDLHFFAIAANLSYVARVSTPTSGYVLSAEEKAVLSEIQTTALQVFQQRIAGTTGFNWQVDIWKDHPDYKFDGCTGSEFPNGPCRREIETTEDISHSSRWPWWLQSLRGSWPERSPNYAYYGNLQRRLGDQLVDHVITYTAEGRPLFNNYLGGGNGWYRVRYSGRNWGYGPSALSDVLPLGDYFLLGRNNSKIKQFARRACNVLGAQDAGTTAFRKKYYGFRSPKADDVAGYGDLDPAAADSAWRFQCSYAAALGLF